MAQKKTTRTRKTAPKKRPVRKKNKTGGLFASISIGKSLVFLLLLGFFIVSIAVVSYVIFFRVVVAEENSVPGKRPGIAVISERTNLCSKFFVS